MISNVLAERTAKARHALLNKALQKRKPATISDSFLSCPIQEANDIAIRQIPEACNPKWSAEDQDLIDWVTKNLSDALFPHSGKIVREKIENISRQGPNCTEAQDGSFSNGLRFIKQVIETEQKINTQCPLR